MMEREGRRMKRWSVLAMLLALVAMWAVGASADEVTDAIAGAEQAYGAKDYKEASTQLQTALVGVNKLLIGLIEAELPEPPAGWNADEPEGTDATALGAGFFGSVMVSRRYTTPDDTSVTMTVAANSPMIGALQAYVTNPMLAAMTGDEMKKVEVCGYDAIEEFNEDDDEASINILAGRATLISVEGDGFADAGHVETLAGMVDCARIVELVE
jgi:hypothetical protein